MKESYKIEKLKNSKQMACDGWVYSAQRLDLLIITISSAGVYVVLEALKFAYEKRLNNIFLLKVSGIVFVISIIINFISQLTGQKANKHHANWIDAQLDAGDNPSEVQLTEITAHDCNANYWNKLTDRFNIISMISMFTGLALVISYFLFTI